MERKKPDQWMKLWCINSRVIGGMLNAGARSDPAEELVMAADVALEVDAVVIRLEMGKMAAAWQNAAPPGRLWRV